MSVYAINCNLVYCSVLFLEWGYGILTVIIISLCSLLGVAIIPFMDKVFYYKAVVFLISLAVGTLVGDALLHLFPHVSILQIILTTDSSQTIPISPIARRNTRLIVLMQTSLEIMASLGIRIKCC